VATDQSDEYHSTNGGTSWMVPSFMAIRGNHEAPVQYTATPSLLYALGPSNYPVESVDGGQTWTYLLNNPASNADSLIVNYNNPNQFFISSYSQFFFTNDGGRRDFNYDGSVSFWMWGFWRRIWTRRPLPHR
jgi:hypothetical protein